MAYQLREIFICLCLAALGTTVLAAQGNFEDAELVNEFITMSFSTSHPYDLRHTIPGEPDIDYPIYSAVPKTSFDCIGRHEGYYADTEARCQVFRICANTDLVGRGFAFLCPNGTLFSQKNFVCDWYRNVDCSESELYYSKNDGNRIGSKAEIMETVRQMMEHPMKTISIALNRGKLATPQPVTVSSSPAVPIRNNANQQFNSRRQPVTLRQIESAAGLTELGSQKRPDFAFAGRGRSPPVQSSQSTRTLTQTQNKFPVTYGSPSPSQETPLGAIASVSSTPANVIENSSDGSGVYVSNLGELSTDPEANFNPQTARIIAEPTGNPVDVQFRGDSGNLNKMNFAEKVNAGLNGQEIVNKNEIIAPEYVRNIIQQNVPLPRSTIQPPPFSFASNINSLLDEVAYEAELEGQTSVRVQSETVSAKADDDNTKKPFRFLSRGFSYDNKKIDGSYTYSPPSVGKSSSLTRNQPSTSTQSYSKSFTTPAPVATTEAIHISTLDSTTTSKLETTPNFSGRVANELIQGEGEGKSLSGTKSTSFNSKKEEIALRFGGENEQITDAKKEQKDAVTSLNSIPQEISDDDKASANKRAENLLLAGVKQTILDTDLNKNYLEETAPIVPLYVRVPEQKGTTTTTTPTPSTSTTSVFRFRSIPTSTTTPSSTRSTSTTEGSRRYTVGSARRRPSPRPTIQSRRRNPVRSGLKSTATASSSTTTTTARPSARSRPVSQAPASTTTAIPTTTRPNSNTSRRRTVSRFSFGSGSRRGSSTSTTTTTTTAAPDKKIAVRSSDKETSDLTAVASTYNAAPKRDYNSIRQTPYRQTQRRRPTQKPSRSETTTYRVTTTTTTTKQPSRSSSSSSLPIVTLAPFTHEELSSLSSTSTTPEPLPASYLSFQDLTKAIFDDSLLQNFKQNQQATGSTVRVPTTRTHPHSHVRQQLAVTTTKSPRTQERVTPKPTVATVTSAPHVPLKQFIVNKFGVNNSPNPPTANKIVQTTPAPRSSTLSTVQKQPNFSAQYPRQQFIVQQSPATRTAAPIKPAPAVQHALPIQAVQQQPLRQPQFVIQRLQQAPLQQQFFQVRQQQPVPQQQFIQFEQKLPMPAPAVFRPVQSVQLIQPIQQTSFNFPTQQQRLPTQQQQQRAIIQRGQEILQRTIPSVQQLQQVPQVQQFHSIQQSQQIQPPQPQQQQFQPAQGQSQIQIFPSQMTVSQTIPAQPSNTSPEVGSINVRLPTNLAGLIPNTNLLETTYRGDAFSQAQKRIDQAGGDVADLGDGQSVYSGLTSYDVPLNSVGRLANDITNLLRKLRRL